MVKRKFLPATVLVRSLGVILIGSVLYFGVQLWGDLLQARSLHACATDCPGTEASGTLVGGWDMRDERFEEWSVRDAGSAAPYGAFLPSSGDELAKARGSEVRAWTDGDRIAAIDVGNDRILSGSLTLDSLLWRAATLLGVSLVALVILTYRIAPAQRLSSRQVFFGTAGASLAAAGILWRTLDGAWFWVPLALGVALLILDRAPRGSTDPGDRRAGTAHWLRRWAGTITALALAVGLVSLGLSERAEMQVRSNQIECRPGESAPCAETYPARVGRRAQLQQRRGGTFFAIYFEVDDATRYWGLFDPEEAFSLDTGDRVQVAVYRDTAYWATTEDGSAHAARGVQTWTPWLFLGLAAALGGLAITTIVRRTRISGQPRNLTPSGS